MVDRLKYIGCLSTQLLICVLLLAAEIPYGHADDNVLSPRPLEADEVTRLEPTRLKELVVSAQDMIEITSKLDGVLVVGMKLGKPNDQRVRTVELEGRVRDALQRQLVAKVVTSAMQSESFWSTSDDEFVVNAENLAVTSPNADIGTKNLGSALEQFFAGQHAQADMLFTQALVESPGLEAIHYWKAANWIAQKQTARAERRLQVLARRNPKGSNAYAAQLQRLQGPYRRTLIELEQKVMLENRLGTGSKTN